MKPRNLFDVARSRQKFHCFLLCCFITVLCPRPCNAQAHYNSGEFAIDTSLSLIICDRIPPQNTAEGFVSFGPDTFQISPALVPVTGTPYPVTKDSRTFTLYFTQTPIVQITVPPNSTINDLYTIPGTFSLNDTNGVYPTFNMNISVRGATSATYPKKSYKLSLLDPDGNEVDTSLLGMRTDQTWLLLAMWDEPLRINNYLSHNLWRKIHTLYYAAKEPDAHASIRLQYVEVMINGRYQGVYALAEKMDRKELQLKKVSATGTVRGELYKSSSWGGANTFDTVPPLMAGNDTMWGGWEVDYPDTTDWINMYNLTRFVVNSDSATFRDSIFSYIREDNLADYFIFVNLLRANDNVGKNLYWAKYNTGEPYFIAPWDLNGTWGYYYDGSHVDYLPILSNNLFNRLIAVDPDSFRISTARRWFSLRENVLSSQNLRGDILGAYNQLLQDGAYAREQLVWNWGLHYTSSEINYVLNWTDGRLGILDTYFSQFLPAVPLPLSLLSFQGQPDGNKINLSWVTANEQNIQSYELQRSCYNAPFSTIATITKEGNAAQQQEYTYSDSLFQGHKILYRLKINTVEKADTTFSRVISVDMGTNPGNTIFIYPNPAGNYIRLNWNGPLPQPFTITDMKGNVRLRGTAASADVKADVSALPAAVYILKIGNEVFPFVKK